MSQAAAVETYDWIDTTSLAELVANFARVHMLVSLFDGEPGKWIDFLEEGGTAEERESDLPFVRDVQRRMADDPHYLDRLRKFVHDFSQLMTE